MDESSPIFSPLIPRGCHASGHNLGGQKHASCARAQHIASLRPSHHWPFRFVSLFIICQSSFALSAPVLSLDQAPGSAPPPQYPTGDWFGFHTTLANNGLTIAGLTQLDVTQNLRGGADTNAT